MKQRKFLKREAIYFGWSLTKQNFLFFIKLLTFIALINITIEILGFFIKHLYISNSTMYILYFVFRLIIDIIIEMGLINVSLKLYEVKKAKFIDFFSSLSLFLNYLGTLILVTPIILLGYIFLIFPGVILQIRFRFFGYFIIDKKYNPIEALKRSWIITQGSVWNLFLFDILLAIIYILGFITFIIGLYIAIPVIEISNVFVYKKLLSFFEYKTS